MGIFVKGDRYRGGGQATATTREEDRHRGREVFFSGCGEGEDAGCLGIAWFLV